jgi:hypothetical protein
MIDAGGACSHRSGGVDTPEVVERVGVVFSFRVFLQSA